MVRIHNTNTGKLIHAHVPVEGGEAAVRGDFALDGVPGTGARIALDFLDPGGAVTGRLLPTGRAQDALEVAGLGPIAASLVDATNPMVFVRAKDLGLDGTERPEDLDARSGAAGRGSRRSAARRPSGWASRGPRRTRPNQRRRAEDRDRRAAGRLPHPGRRGRSSRMRSTSSRASCRWARSTARSR